MLPAVLGWGRHRRGRAFTLVELLVVIGIIAVLISLLIASLSMVRERSTQVLCQSRLRALAQACVLYLNERKEYPYHRPQPAYGAAQPSGIDAELANLLLTTMKLTEVDPAKKVNELPKLLRCPAREVTELFLDPDPSGGFPAWNVGYAYYARLDDPDNLTGYGTLLNHDRIADRRGKRRGVLWGDYLLYGVFGPLTGYGFFHTHGNPDANAAGMIQKVNTLQGVHRAWSDGSVEWLPKGGVDLLPASVNQDATYRLALPGGAFTLYYYF
ncbi:MAG: type II secretion system protein [Tepidisphaeraceae bacterium]